MGQMPHQCMVLKNALADALSELVKRKNFNSGILRNY